MQHNSWTYGEITHHRNIIDDPYLEGKHILVVENISTSCLNGYCVVKLTVGTSLAEPQWWWILVFFLRQLGLSPQPCEFVCLVCVYSCWHTHEICCGGGWPGAARSEKPIVQSSYHLKINHRGMQNLRPRALSLLEGSFTET